MSKASQKKLKEELKKYYTNKKEIFPRSKLDYRRDLTPYQARKARKILGALKPPEKAKRTHRIRALKEGRILLPDKAGLIHFEKAGYEREGKKIYYHNTKINIHTLYKSEGNKSYYSASFFGGVIHAVLIPTISLPDFLEQQIKLDEENGKFYDKITLKENDRSAWGQDSGFSSTHDTAEEFLLSLTQYKRHGALIGGGGTFEYIQVCFLIFGG